MSQRSFRKKIQGEFFDCTVQGYNDFGHGTHKINYALQYGISTPLQKYIEELEKIQEGTQDDKSAKRDERLRFLISIRDVDVLVSYFQHFTTYLNGGSYFPDCDEVEGNNFETNKIIITAAGGNIITIFAKLLQDLLINGDRTEIYFNSLMLRQWSLNGYLNHWIVNCPEEARQFIEYMAAYDFSDFDYNILPNKCINNFDEGTNTEESYEGETNNEYNRMQGTETNVSNNGDSQNNQMVEQPGFGHQHGFGHQPGFGHQHGFGHQPGFGHQQGWYHTGGAAANDFSHMVPNYDSEGDAGFFFI